MRPTSKRLPPEVMLAIKKHIPVSDLRTHVCLYLSSPSCAALYDSEPDANQFWELACWRCGVGRLPGEDSVTLDWQAVAVYCIIRDGFCKHPQCGEALLSYNRESMREVEEDIEELYEPVRITEDYEGAPFPHRAFGGIRFRPGYEVGPFRRHHLGDDAYLRKDETTEDVEENRTYLKDHPLLARSFATFVPTSSIFLIDIFGLLGFGVAHKLETWRPITVHDVLSMMHKILDQEISVSNAADYVHLHERCIEKQGWSIGTVFSKLRNLREILTVCPLEGLQYEENTNSGPAFAFEQQ
ncbi:hypothetical protein C8T65DRAFT_644946 [Cerioporus squamosus]|nr:hypothetical protein C8T65DRAFT_644946 [Cerioporus squamosus]